MVSPTVSEKSKSLETSNATPNLPVNNAKVNGKEPVSMMNLFQFKISSDDVKKNDKTKFPEHSQISMMNVDKFMVQKK